MAVPFEQLVAATYDEVVTERNKAHDQWSDSSFLKALEKHGGVKRVSGGPKLQVTLDYRQNPAADFLATDTTNTSTSKTEVLTAAEYDWGMLIVPTNWTFKDEALNSSANQKVELASALVDNALATHDQMFEEAFFAATGGTDGFNTIVDIYSENGEGTVGTIVSGTETWWKNQYKDWGTDTGATLLADYETLYISCAKGSSGKKPNLIVGSGTMYGNFVATLTPNQRFTTSGNASGSYDDVSFKHIPFIFSSEYTSDSAWMFNTADTKLYIVSGAWRQRRKQMDHVNAPMVNQKIFSIAQFATSNRSRGGVLFT